VLYSVERLGAFIENSETNNIDQPNTAVKFLSMSLKIKQDISVIDMYLLSICRMQQETYFLII